MSFYEILLKAHSGWAYLTILAGVFSLIVVGFYTINKRVKDVFVKKLLFFTVLIFHIQLVSGAILYFKSPKVGVDAYFTYEHPVVMFLSVLLITFASSIIKKSETVKISSFVLILVAMVILLARIPWEVWSK